MARLIPVTCPKCGAEVDLDPGEELVKCTYCGTSSFVSKEERRDAQDESGSDLLESESNGHEEWKAQLAERERKHQAEMAELDREAQARLAVMRREDEARLRLAVEEDRVRERNRRIAIFVLAALPISAFLALYLTK